MTRAVFALLLVGAPVALIVKIRGQRRTLGRSPVILGRVGAGALERWFERLGPIALLFWPFVWVWVVAGDAPLAHGARCLIGTFLVVVGAALSGASIFLMGRAWRIGIDPDNRTDLADTGPYRWIRHPIYSGWLVLLLGSILVVQHPMIPLAALVTAIGVLYEALREERHLLRTFGARYAQYLARTGRFAPRLRAH